MAGSSATPAAPVELPSETSSRRAFCIARWVGPSMLSWMSWPGDGACEEITSRPTGSPAALTSTTSLPGVPFRNCSYCCSIPPLPTVSFPA